MRVYAIGIEASSDMDGNHRKGWLVYDENGICFGFLDQMDSTDWQVLNTLAKLSPKTGGVKVVQLATVKVLNSEYRTAKRLKQL